MSSSNEGISVSKAEENENKRSRCSSYANGVKTNVESSGGASVTENKYVTKMKSLTNRLVQAHEFDSEVDEEWVTYMNSRGWLDDQI